MPIAAEFPDTLSSTVPRVRLAHQRIVCVMQTSLAHRWTQVHARSSPDRGQATGHEDEVPDVRQAPEAKGSDSSALHSGRQALERGPRGQAGEIHLRCVTQATP
jgi:hypothetical protein